MKLQATLAALACALQLASGQNVVRKEIRLVTDAEWAAYARAVNALKESGVWDEMATLHGDLFSSGIHNGPQFLPWHRYYLNVLETELQKIEPGVFIPYWDWTLDAADTTSAPTFVESRFGTFPEERRGCVTTGSFAGFEPCIRRNDLYDHQGWTAADVRRAYRGSRGPSQYDNMRDGVEGIHNMVHVGVGGNMNSGRSPYDPIFYSHHAMIDKIWWDWQNEAPENFNAYPEGRENDLILGYESSGVTVSQMFETSSYGARPARVASLRAPTSIDSVADMERTKEVLATLTPAQLAQIPRTCPAPKRPAVEERGMFWSAATERAIAEAEQTVDLSLQGDANTCLSLDVVAKVANLGSAEVDPGVVGDSGPSQEIIVAASAGAGVLVVGAVVATVMRKRNSASAQSHPGALQMGQMQMHNPQYAA